MAVEKVTEEAGVTGGEGGIWWVNFSNKGVVYINQDCQSSSIACFDVFLRGWVEVGENVMLGGLEWLTWVYLQIC